MHFSADSGLLEPFFRCEFNGLETKSPKLITGNNFQVTGNISERTGRSVRGWGKPRILSLLLFPSGLTTEASCKSGRTHGSCRPTLVVFTRIPAPNRINRRDRWLPMVSGGLIRPTSNYRFYGRPRRPIRSATSSTPTLNRRPRLRNLINPRCLPNEFQQ